MNILGIDPGNKPGYFFQAGAFTVASTRWPDAPTFHVHAIVTEGVWFGGDAPPASIAKLAFTCGLQTMRAWMRYPDAKVYRLPVKVWKDAICYRGSTLPGHIFLGRLRQALNIPLGDEWSDDELCARGLVEAFVRLGGPDGKLEKYRIKEPK